MNKIFLYTTIIGFISFSAFGQEKKKDLGTEVINVVKAYNPEISDAFKIQISPDEELDKVEKQKIEYNTLSTDVASTFKPSPIRAKSQPRSGRSKGDLDNYFVLGYGNYTTPLVELYMNNKKVKEHRYGIQVKHLSSQGGIKDVKYNDAFMNTSLGGFYWKQFKNYQLKTNLTYAYQSINWYGVPNSVTTDELVKKLNVGQYYQTIQGDASYTYNGKKDDAIFKKANFSAYRMGDRYDSHESRIKLGGDFAIPIEGQSIKIRADFDFIDTYFAQNIANTSDVTNRFMNFGLTPSFQILKDDVTINLGVLLAYSADLSGSDSQFRVYPKVSASVNVIDDLMIAYASLEGGMYQNSLQSVVRDMPYLAPNMDVTPTSVSYDFTAGIRGKLMANLSYDTHISFRNENGFIQYIDSKGADLPLATAPKGWEAWNSFNAIQDTVKVLSFYAEVEYKLMKGLNISADLLFNGYSSQTFDKVYNQPNLKLSLAADYRFMEDFTVGTSMYFVSRRDYLNNPTSSSSPVVTEEGQLPSYFDLNLKAGYDVTKKLGTFIRLNNVLNQKYELFKNYPVQGFQAMAGVTYKF